MVLGHHSVYQNVSIDILIEYNIEEECVEDVLSIIALDLNDGEEVELTSVLYHKFPSTIKYMVNSINWHNVYESTKTPAQE